MSAELKPCPFCRGDAKLEHSLGSWGYYAAKDWVKCTGCGVSGPAFEDEVYDWEKRLNITVDSKGKAAEAWNRRDGERAAREQVIDELRDIENDDPGRPLIDAIRALRED